MKRANSPPRKLTDLQLYGLLKKGNPLSRTSAFTLQKTSFLGLMAGA